MVATELNAKREEGDPTAGASCRPVILDLARAKIFDRQLYANAKPVVISEVFKLPSNTPWVWYMQDPRHLSSLTVARHLHFNRFCSLRSHYSGKRKQ